MTKSEPQTSSSKILAFVVNNVLCGLPVESVVEVTGNIVSTSVPGSPKNIKGIASLRGKVVTVINTGVRDAHNHILVKTVTEVFALPVEKVLGLKNAEPQTKDKTRTRDKLYYMITDESHDRITSLVGNSGSLDEKVQMLNPEQIYKGGLVV